MNTKPVSTDRTVHSTLQTSMVLLTPVWIILATLIHAMLAGTVQL